MLGRGTLGLQKMPVGMAGRECTQYQIIRHEMSIGHRYNRIIIDTIMPYRIHPYIRKTGGCDNR